METNTAMNRNDAAGDPLAVARGVLLEPHGLDVKDLNGAIGRIFEHKVDYADLYFQYTRSEGWSLDEGIVKSGSFAIEQGVGVRAVSGDRSAFAYSDEINAQALMSAADATRTIARGGRSGRTRVGDAQAAPADVVLIAGKGRETTQEIAGVFHPFSDPEIAAQALASHWAVDTREMPHA